jgi:hypothetical protein
MSLIPVEDNPGLVRDTNSGALVYTDVELINKRKEARRLRKQAQQEVTQLRSEVESLHDEVSEMKQLLIQLVENSK